MRTNDTLWRQQKGEEPAKVRWMVRERKVFFKRIMASACRMIEMLEGSERVVCSGREGVEQQKRVVIWWIFLPRNEKFKGKNDGCT